MTAVVRDWDSPGLPPRAQDERCARHDGCAYRDDDPAYCPYCHRSWERIEHPLPGDEPQTRAEHRAEHEKKDQQRDKQVRRRSSRT